MLRSICVFCGSSARRSRPANTRPMAARALRRARSRGSGQRLVYGGGNIGTMGVLARRRARRGSRGRPASYRAGSTSASTTTSSSPSSYVAEPTCTSARRSMAEAVGRLHRPAWRHRHPRGALRGLDLAPHRLPREARRPPRRGRLLPPPARLPREGIGRGLPEALGLGRSPRRRGRRPPPRRPRDEGPARGAQAQGAEMRSRPLAAGGGTSLYSKP